MIHLNEKNEESRAESADTTKNEVTEFTATFSEIVKELTCNCQNPEIEEALKWFAGVLECNVPGGKLNRGLAVISSYKTLLKKDHLSSEESQLTNIMGWCVEMLQAHYLVLDDVMDGSTTRRGQLCWYQNKNVGLKAINDGLLLKLGVFQLLKKYFKEKTYYHDVIELFNDTDYNTTMGQCLDLLSALDDNKPNFSQFTMNRYNSIVKYKTAYYSFHLPVALAMYMVGIRDEKVHHQAKKILLEIGHFFQVQDDYLDCFGDPEKIGKIGTDIEEGKCSWLAVTAWQKADSNQRRIMEESYGYSDEEKVKTIKKLYADLGIDEIYSAYEEESYSKISALIQQSTFNSSDLPQELFFDFLNKIYKRNR